MKLAKDTLVLVADGKKMRLFKNTGSALKIELTPILQRELPNPPSREQGADAPGRTRSRMDARRSSYSETDWHDQAESDFAVRVAADLSTMADQNRASTIIVIAAPGTLGNLRKHYDRPTRERINAELNLDLVNHSVDDVVKVIAEFEG